MENERSCETALVSELEARIRAELLPIAAELKARGQSVTAAESLSGGLMSAFFVDIPGSSDWFSDGFVVYSNEAKEKRLGVPKALLDGNTAVDAEVAIEMARGARRMSGADYAVSLTGLAGPFFNPDGSPIPLDPRHVPGLVFIGCASETGEAVRRFEFSGTRAEIRRKSVLKAVLMLKNMMKIGG